MPAGRDELLKTLPAELGALQLLRPVLTPKAPWITMRSFVVIVDGRLTPRAYPGGVTMMMTGSCAGLPGQLHQAEHAATVVLEATRD